MQVHMDQKMGVEVVRAKGRFNVEHWRGGERVNVYVFNNAITNEGKDKLLDVMFHAVTPITTWWIGLIDYTGYTALAATDTAHNIDQAGNGWDEFTDYTDAGNGASASTRPEWVEGASSSQSVTNASAAIFDITDTGTVTGGFLVGGVAAAQNKGDHTSTATLWATALMGADIPVTSGDQLKITYTVTA